MSNKLTCPACGSHLSSIWDGDPCPECGLSAEAAAEVTIAARRGAEAGLVERAAKADARAAAAEAEVRRLTSILADIGSLSRIDALQEG